MVNNYEDYKNYFKNDIHDCMSNMGSQPILFIGSGFSRRYFNGPNWEELLTVMAEMCPEIRKSFAYYKQVNNDYGKIGTEFVNFFQEWAWGSGKEKFPDNLFNSDINSSIYLKHKVCEYLENITPKSYNEIKDKNLLLEIESLRKIAPHAIITTNFDKFVETIFSDYEPIIGQKILRHQSYPVGEIFKIHGCTSDPATLVLTSNDYEEFIQKKKYLSAKLLAFFLEHPLIFIGYSASDENIKSILSDIDEILSHNNKLIENIYFIEWCSDNDITSKQYEKLIQVSASKSVRIKNISTSSFEWVFNIFATNNFTVKVNPKVLRLLAARTYDLIRHDIPNQTLEVDFKILEHAVSSSEEFAKIYGITSIKGNANVNITHPYTLSSLSTQLGGTGWKYGDNLIQRITKQHGINIKESDNIFHYAIKTGTKETSITHKYSEAARELLLKVKNNEDILELLNEMKK